MSIQDEIKKRRTFAIISHPDAGKTTITEQLLYFGGEIREAGTVKGKKTGNFAKSDWMDIEKQRGISVTSSVMQFDYAGKRVNILDTPGHEDFSEDTYRTLMAVDAAVMVVDSAKGIEAQTKKLFEVVKHRGIPVFTFMNKLDRDGREPLDLLEELEEVLGTLTEREQKVLILRFGLEDGRARTLEEVGKEFNVTRERIRQIEAKALRKLRHPSRSRKLKDYLE